MFFIKKYITLRQGNGVIVAITNTQYFQKKEQTNKPKLKTGTAAGFLGLFLPTNQNEQTGACMRFWFVHPKIKGTNTNPPGDFGEHFRNIYWNPTNFVKYFPQRPPKNSSRNTK